MSRLLTLKLCNEPDFFNDGSHACDDSDHHGMLDDSEFDQLGRSTAEKVFSRLHEICPHLVLLDIEARDPRAKCEVNRRYLRSKQSDLYGHVKYVGALTKFAMIKHHEPASDILEPEKFLRI